MTDTIDIVLEHFAWYEEHSEQLQSPYVDKYELLDELKKALYKECISLFIKDPDMFRELCDMPEFYEQVQLYGLTAYVNQVIHG